MTTADIQQAYLEFCADELIEPRPWSPVAAHLNRIARIPGRPRKPYAWEVDDLTGDRRRVRQHQIQLRPRVQCVQQQPKQWQREPEGPVTVFQLLLKSFDRAKSSRRRSRAVERRSVGDAALTLEEISSDAKPCSDCAYRLWSDTADKCGRYVSAVSGLAGHCYDVRMRPDLCGFEGIGFVLDTDSVPKFLAEPDAAIPQILEGKALREPAYFEAPDLMIDLALGRPVCAILPMGRLSWSDVHYGPQWAAMPSVRRHCWKLPVVPGSPQRQHRLRPRWRWLRRADRNPIDGRLVGIFASPAAIALIEYHIDPFWSRHS